MVLLRQGKCEAAVPMLKRSVGFCKAEPLRLWRLLPAAELGCAYARSGRVAEALAPLQQALDDAESMSVRSRQSILTLALGEAYLVAGRIDEARQLAARALEAARRQSERGREAWTLRLLGEIAADRDTPDVGAAEASYGEAISIADELGMRPLTAHCHFGLGRLYRHTSKREQAHEHLATAAAMYREMGIQPWRGRTE